MSKERSKQSARSRARSNGEGTIYWREDRQRWVVEFIVDNFTAKRRRVVRTFKTKEEASRHLNKLRLDHEDGAVTVDDNIRYDQYLDYWLELVDASERKGSTKASYRENVRLHVKPALGRLQLKQIRHEHLQRFLIAKRDEGYSKSTMKTFRSILCLSFDQAVLEDRVTRNLARNVSLPKAKKAPRKVSSWTLDEVRRFVDTAKNDRMFAAYVLLAMVGLRKGELLALQWTDFDVEARTLHIHQQIQRVKGVKGLIVDDPKSLTSKRLIHLPHKCIDVLQQHRERQDAERERAALWWKDHDLIFPSQDGTYTDPRHLNRMMDAMCKRAGITSLGGEARGPHSLRHTAATVARALGVDWKEIQAMLGHASIKITMDIYVDMVPELQREAADRIDEGYRLPEEGDNE